MREFARNLGSSEKCLRDLAVAVELFFNAIRFSSGILTEAFSSIIFKISKHRLPDHEYIHKYYKTENSTLKVFLHFFLY
jgi:hypothetical protein